MIGFDDEESVNKEPDDPVVLDPVREDPNKISSVDIGENEIQSKIPTIAQPQEVGDSVSGKDDQKEEPIKIQVSKNEIKDEKVESVVKTVADKVDEFIFNSETDVPTKASVKVNFTQSLDATKVEILKDDEILEVEVAIAGSGNDFKVELPIDNTFKLDTQELEEVLDVSIEPSFEDYHDSNANKIIAKTVTKAVEDILNADDKDSPTKLVINLAESPEIEEIDVSIEHFNRKVLANITSPGQSKKTETIELPIDQVDDLETSIKTNLDIKEILDVSIEPSFNDIHDTNVNQVLANTINKAVENIVNAEDTKIPPSTLVVNLAQSPLLEEIDVSIEHFDEKVQANVTSPGPSVKTNTFELPIEETINLESEIKSNLDIQEVLDFSIEPSFNDIHDSEAHKVIADTITKAVEDIVKSDDTSSPPSTLIVNVAKGPAIEEIDVAIEQFEKKIQANITSPGKSEKVDTFELPIAETDKLKTDIQEVLDFSIEPSFNDVQDSEAHKVIADTITKAVEDIVKSDDSKSKPSTLVVNVEKSPSIEEVDVAIEQFNEKIQANIMSPGKFEKVDTFELPIAEPDQLKTNIQEVLDFSIEPSFNDINDPEAKKVIADTITKVVEDIVKADDSSLPPSTLVVNVTKSPSIEEVDVSIEQFDQKIHANITSPGKSDKVDTFELPIEEGNKLKTNIQEVIDFSIEPSFSDIHDSETNNAIADTITKAVEDIVKSDTSSSPPSTLVVNVEKSPAIEEIDVAIEQLDQKIQANITSPGKSEKVDTFKLPIAEADKLKTNIKTNLDAIEIIDAAIEPSFYDINDANKIIANTIKGAVEDIVKADNDAKSQPPSTLVVNVAKSPVIEEIDVSIEHFEEKIFANITSPGEKAEILDTFEVSLENISNLDDQIKTNLDTKEKEKKDESLVKEISQVLHEFVQSDKSQLPRMVRIDIIKNKGFEEIDVAIQQHKEEGEEEIIKIVAQVPAKDNVNITFTVIPGSKTEQLKDLDKINLENDITKNLQVPKIDDPIIKKKLASKIKDVATKAEVPSTIVIEVEGENDVTESNIDLEEESSQASDDVKFNVKVPSDKQTTKVISIEVPKKKGDEGKVDEERLEEIFDEEIVSLRKDAPDFEMNFGELGITVGTRPTEDSEAVTTNVPRRQEDFGFETTSESFNIQDIMSIDKFGFTISAPVTSEVTEKGKVSIIIE